MGPLLFLIYVNDLPCASGFQSTLFAGDTSLDFSNICKATTVTHTKRIYRNLLRKETSFVCYTSSVLRKSHGSGKYEMKR